MAYDLPRASDVRMEVFSLSGDKVREWVNERQQADPHAVPFNAASLPSGVYVVRLTAGGFMQQRKMVLMK